MEAVYWISVFCFDATVVHCAEEEKVEREREREGVAQIKNVSLQKIEVKGLRFRSTDIFTFLRISEYAVQV